MKLSVSSLRANIYRILDQVLKTGKSIEIVCKGRIVRISPVEPVGRLALLEKRDIIKGDPEELVHMDWSKEWKGKLP